MKNLHSLDLRPGQNTRKRRVLWLRLGIAEAAIFLCVAAAALTLRLFTQAAWRQSVYLEGELQAGGYAEAEQAALAVREAEARLEAEADLPADWFAYGRLAHINASVPEGAALRYIEMTENATTVISDSDDLKAIEKHRDALAGGGWYAQVKLGEMERLGNGGYRYTLTLGER
jgi:hypothetical protein